VHTNLIGCRAIRVRGAVYGTEWDQGDFFILPNEECNGRPIYQRRNSNRFLYYSSGGTLSNGMPGWTVKWYSDFSALECNKVGQIFAFTDELCSEDVEEGTWKEKNNGALENSPTVVVECSK